MGPRLSHETSLINESQSENHIKVTEESAQKNPNHEAKEGLRSSLTGFKNSTLKVGDSTPSVEREALVIIQKYNKQCEDKNLIEQCILQNFFMRALDSQARLEIIKKMSLACVKKGAVIFTQGNMGSYFYILKQGSVSLEINGKQVKILTVGESFGELALLHGAPRSGTVIAVEECYLWVLERKNFRKIVEYITKINFEENKTFIQSIPILAHIDHYLQTILCVSLIKHEFDAGKYIVKEGEMSNCIYIIKEGEVNCMSKTEVIRTLKKGDNFGERSILVESPRTMDVVAKTKCICFSISIGTLINMLGEKYKTYLYLGFIKSSFATSSLFRRFNSYLIEQTFKLFKAVNLGKDTVAFPSGYIKSSNIVIIVDGHLINSKTQETVGDRGSILFENELLNNSSEQIDYDIIPCPDCLLVKADTSEVVKLLGANLSEVMEKSEIIDSLSKMSIFKNLPRKKLELIAQKIGIEKYEEKQKIISEGETGNKFYIVKKGQIDIFVKGKYIRTLNEKEYFGERALFFNEGRTASAFAKQNVELFYVSQEDFISNIEANMKKHLMNRLYLQDNTIELKDLEFCAQLGSGNYGNVSLVTSTKNKFNYAIKGISRKQIDYEGLHQNLELERSILLQIDHPFIVKLVKTLKDPKFIYFLMEYIEGKELFDVIREIGILSKEQTQFYGGSIILALEYLHEKKFIYRDIKPENIMVLYTNGYVKLIDFGTAKKIEDRTSTIIGTPYYMAPEIILGQGYSFQVDFWSLAVCMYEFMCGRVPFGESAEDPMEVYLSIVNSKLTFPTFCKDKDFKKLMVHMLCKNPVNRLTKINQIKNHVWFQNFNWDELITLNMPSAYLPNKGKCSANNKALDETNLKGMKFCDYVNKYYKEYIPKSGFDLIDNNKIEEYENWYNNY